MINSRENGLFMKSCAIIIAIYHNWGQGNHGKIDQAIASIQRIIHIIQHIISIVFKASRLNYFNMDCYTIF